MPALARGKRRLSGNERKPVGQSPYILPDTPGKKTRLVNVFSAAGQARGALTYGALVASRLILFLLRERWSDEFPLAG
jgi:hypothetical protein